jgi:hypothetical protein
METASQFLLPGTSFLLTLASGVWLSHLGKPYNAAVFNVHKLIALGAVVATALQTYRAVQGASRPALAIALILLAGLCVVALFVTGALMSLGKPAHDRLLTLHRVAPLVGVSAMAAVIFMISSGSGQQGQ